MKTHEPSTAVIPLSRLGMLPPAGSGQPAPVPPPPARTNTESLPDLTHLLHSLDCGHPHFREPVNHEWIVGLYREDDGRVAPVLLWADPQVDLFWDLHLRRHVRPPAFYLRIAQQPQVDPQTGYPIVDGAVCPY